MQFCQPVEHFEQYVNDKCPENCMKAHPEWKKQPFINVGDAAEEAKEMFGLDSKGRAKRDRIVKIPKE